MAIRSSMDPGKEETCRFPGCQRPISGAGMPLCSIHLRPGRREGEPHPSMLNSLVRCFDDLPIEYRRYLAWTALKLGHEEQLEDQLPAPLEGWIRLTRDLPSRRTLVEVFTQDIRARKREDIVRREWGEWVTDQSVTPLVAKPGEPNAVMGLRIGGFSVDGDDLHLVQDNSSVEMGLDGRLTTQVRQEWQPLIIESGGSNIAGIGPPSQDVARIRGLTFGGPPTAGPPPPAPKKPEEKKKPPDDEGPKRKIRLE